MECGRLPALLLVGLALLAGLSGCTRPTSYAAAGGTPYGYSEERLDGSTWRVQFAGNSATPRERVETLLLYRAAELARTQEAGSFVVLDQGVERKSSYHGTLTPGYPFGFYRHGFLFHGKRSHFGFVRPYVGFGASTLRQVDRYTGHATVRLFENEPPEGLGVPYDTAEVLSTLGTRVQPPASDSQSGS